ncbi:MAG: L,D-transpeptidase family protein [Cytophagaceae bacterium]|jgi:murein L,D-transpeptidase YcbB/YkuD|nr:L,D-transpeptidase family protein [Cytophagaceae bacterium]
MSYLKYICFISILFIFFSCEETKKLQDADGEDTLTKGATLSSTWVKKQLYVYLQLDSLKERQTDSILSSIYSHNAYHPFWSDSLKREVVINWLDSLYFEGLQPQQYDLESLRSKHQKWIELEDSLRADWEVNATRQIIRAVLHQWYGKTNPRSIFDDWAYQETILPLPITQTDWMYFFKKNLGAVLPKIRPTHPIYSSLKQQLFRLKQWEKKGTFQLATITTSKKKLKLGDIDSSVYLIKKRLLNVGLFQQQNINDTFDLALQRAVRIFQKHILLTPTGVIDRTTLNRLNFSKEDFYRIIIVNMERCRWLLKGKLPDEFILVNIADYTLTYSKQDSILFQTAVVVGKDQHETPLFTSKLTTVELNPYWTVPVSIATKEILPKLKQDPSYLRRHNMKLYQGGKEVMVRNFSAYKESYFPFTIRQEPGKDNDLGLVKFLFPNPYSIYFHDTPAKWIFSLDQRNFSHGCIRVQNPLAFAEVLLKEEGYNRSRIDKIIQSEKNHAVRLKKRIPIYIVYWTFKLVKGEEYFMYDIYGRDKKILKALMN